MYCPPIPEAENDLGPRTTLPVTVLRHGITDAPFHSFLLLLYLEFSGNKFWINSSVWENSHCHVLRTVNALAVQLFPTKA